MSSFNLKVRVTANSRHPGFVDFKDRVLWVKVVAPPADGRANDELCDMVSEALSLPKSSVRVKSGQSSRLKLLSISDVDERIVFAILRQHIPNQNL